MPVFMQMGDISPTDAQSAPATLARLVADLRRCNGGYVLTSVAHGAKDHRMQPVLHELRRLGVMESPVRVPLGLEGSGLGFIGIEAPGGRAGLPAPLPVLLVIAQVQAQAWLIPAVQKVRDAASRMQLPAGTRIFLGGGAPAATGAAVRAGNGAWFLLTRAGNDHEFEYDIVATR